MMYFVSSYDVFHSAYAARRVPTHINRIHGSQMHHPIMNYALNKDYELNKNCLKISIP